jgi:predicted DCC family thiol-disulfide oxidoreductase YuxK
MTYTPPPKKITTVYYDGSCPMCTAFVGATISGDKDTFLLQDITTDTLPPQLTRGAVEREMHVVDGAGMVFKNAAAILHILDTVPYWRRITWIGRLPIIRRIMPIGYGIVARNRHFIFGPASRLLWSKVVVLLGLLAGLLLSFPLWVQTGVITAVPLLPFIPELSSGIEVMFYALVFVLAGASLISPQPQRYLVGMLGVLAVFTLTDQLRLQPWLYQYWFMLLPLAWYSWNVKDVRGRVVVLQTLRIIVAGIYFYSGLQKVTLPFFVQVFPWMMEPLSDLLPPVLQLLPASFGVVVPFIEMAMGIGLLTRRFRFAALIGVVCMMVLVLSMLGPFGHSWNSVVWPWNVAIALLAWILFYRTDQVSLRAIFAVKKYLPHKIALVLFLGMPALSFFGVWDSYPSYSLYSGNTAGGRIFVPPPYEVGDSLRAVGYRTGEFPGEINLQTVSYIERNVPMYPEARVYLPVFTALCRDQLPEDAVLTITSKKTLLAEREERRYRCDELTRRYTK